MKHSPMWFAIKVLLTGIPSSNFNPTSFSNVNRRHSNIKTDKTKIGYTDIEVSIAS